ncbi:PREDICTED: 4-coumarate--CoA ligase 1 [Ceratosolen solmsi marchali]|uniref:Luciferin 4-monooxygenase n=1 Tax=Ceratosolen solmsi marchali TaxID=326594 RepID=A0AAJ6YTJ6_9HYME|nr:PREDICTED: 4-coumarate--CoA ligase 1 [Ceratosolen solmsi marchali]
MINNHKNMDKSFILNGPEFALQLPEGITMGQLIYNKLLSHGTKIAEIQNETDEQLNFKQILVQSCKLATYLKNNQVSVNDRIAICSENNLNFCIPLCASAFIGATICPINPTYKKKEFKHTLNISKPKYIFLSPFALKSIKHLIKELSWSPTLILIFGDADENVPTIKMLLKSKSLLNIETFEVTKVEIDKHIMGILCSSGTTGLPKGVKLTEKNYLKTVQNLLNPSTFFIQKNQILAHLLPFFHTYCFNTLIMGLIIGSTAIIFSHFDEEEFLTTIEKYKIEILTLVPPLMVFLAKHPMVQNYNLSFVKTIWCGAAPLSNEIEQAVKNRLQNAIIRQGYGMTELTFCVLIIPLESNKPGSAGKLISGISAKIIPVNTNGEWSNKTLGPNEKGELCFKGDLVMLGYCGDASATAATIDRDGWLHTGDIAYYDEDGFFYIVDRLKELIKYKGFQVAPAEIETILLTHPEIKDAAVVGLLDETAGELPFAFVVKQQNAKITTNDVVKYINDQVSRHKRLHGGARFIENIPKNLSGKILRRELRNLLNAKL